MSNNKKAVFFDIDGTIFMPNLGVTEKTKEAIVKLNENGIIPVICTGRSRSMIFKSIMDIGFKDVVAGAGTYVEVNSEEIYRVDMKPEDIDEIVEAMVKYGFNPIPEGHDNLYYKDDINTAKYKEIFDLYYSELSEFMKPIRKGETYAAKVSGQFTDKSNKQAMIELFADRYDIVDHRGVLLELIPAGFSKATGIEKFLKATGIKRENTYAFGDSGNDLEMIKYVAHGVAMGNSAEDVKEAADYVTDTIDNDGVYKGLKNYGLI